MLTSDTMRYNLWALCHDLDFTADMGTQRQAHGVRASTAVLWYAVLSHSKPSLLPLTPVMCRSNHVLGGQTSVPHARFPSTPLSCVLSSRSGATRWICRCWWTPPNWIQKTCGQLDPSLDPHPPPAASRRGSARCWCVTSSLNCGPTWKRAWPPEGTPR